MDKMSQLVSEKDLTPGPRQEEMSGDEEAEEDVKHQQHHVFHLGDLQDFRSTLLV